MSEGKTSFCVNVIITEYGEGMDLKQVYIEATCTTIVLLYIKESPSVVTCLAAIKGFPLMMENLPHSAT